MTMQLVLPSGVTLRPRDTPAPPGGLPPHVLERIALHWAERAGCPPGRVVLDEHELGWGLWAPGTSATSFPFVDKLTGRVVEFAHPAHPDVHYGRQLSHEDGAPPRPGSGGPPVETPGAVAEVSVGSSPPVRAGSVRGDEPPALHPLVLARLHRIPARARVRGVDRHPELAALGRAGAGSRNVHVRLWWVREPADPRQGRPARNPCVTCTEVLGLSPPRPGPVPSRWQRHTDRRRLHSRPAPHRAAVADRVDRVLAVRGVEHGHTVFPAAIEALEGYLDASWDLDVPGRSVRTSAFRVDPAAAADTADTMARLARRIGAPLFPLGTAGHSGFLAVDPGHRVFLIDEASEWLLGGGLAAALDTLLLGRRAPRVRDPR